MQAGGYIAIVLQYRFNAMSQVCVSASKITPKYKCNDSRVRVKSLTSTNPIAHECLSNPLQVSCSSAIPVHATY